MIAQVRRRCWHYLNLNYQTVVAVDAIAKLQYIVGTYIYVWGL